MDEHITAPLHSQEKYLNILYLSQYFHPEQFLNNHVAKALVDDGHRVNVVCCVPNYPAGIFYDGYSNLRRKSECWGGVHIDRVFTVPRGQSKYQLVLNFFTYPIAASWKVLWMGRQRDTVSFVSMPSPLLQGLVGIFAKRVWKIPTVFWVQDIWPDSAIITLGIRNRLLIRVLRAVCGWIYRQADLVMVQSHGFHGKIAEFGVCSEAIVTLPNPAPPLFIPVQAEDVPERIRSLIPVGRRIVMFAGNIGESQDFDTVIAAAAPLSSEVDLLIVVLGSGRDERRVRDLVMTAGLEDRFLFLGRRAESDMPFFFACADVMLVSLRDEPIFALTVPSKLQAYMACGKPILASLAGEGAQIISESRIGVVARPSNPNELNAAMTAIASMDMRDLIEMGRRARDAYDQCFSMSAVITTLTQHLRSISTR